MVKIIYNRQKCFDKTDIKFIDENECIIFFKRVLTAWPKSKGYLAELNAQDQINRPKEYIRSLVRIFKIWKGTNAQVILNSPTEVILNGHFDFGGIKMEDEKFSSWSDYVEKEYPNYAE